MKKKEEFIWLNDDLVFKYVFKKEHILKYFLNAYFEYMGIERRVRVIASSAQEFMQANKRVNKDFYGDLVAVLDNGEIISIEMYNNFGREQYTKSLIYMTRLYSNQLKKNQKCKEAKKVTNINLIKGNYHQNNPGLINKKNFIDIINLGLEKDDDLEMVLIRLDKLSESKYNKEEKEFIKILRFINVRSEKEIEEIMIDDKELEEIKEVVRDYLSDPLIDSVKFSIDCKVREETQKAIKQGIKQGIKKGIKEGIEQGLQQGKNEEKKKVAKNMIKEGFDNKMISSITGLSIKELKETLRV